MVAHRFKTADALDPRKVSALQPLPLPPELRGRLTPDRGNRVGIVQISIHENS